MAHPAKTCPYRLGEKVTLPQEGHTGAVTGTVAAYMPLTNGDWRVWLHNDSGLWPCLAKGERPLNPL